jgi:hypothetical protein
MNFIVQKPSVVFGNIWYLAWSNLDLVWIITSVKENAYKFTSELEAKKVIANEISKGNWKVTEI